MQDISAIITAVGVITAVLLLLWQVKHDKEAALLNPADVKTKSITVAAISFAESKLELEDKKKQKHANRESIEKQIKDILEYNTTSADRKFAVVSGRREVGKS